MRGGRLKIVNESRYPDEEVARLVRFGLDEIELTGDRIVAAVKNTRRQVYSGTAWSLEEGIPDDLYDRYCGRRTMTHYLIVMRLGEPEQFPVTSGRKYAGVEQREYVDWREALVGITAHEGMHAQHMYDGAYRDRSGRRAAVVVNGHVAARATRFRVGVERIEPKCEAYENYVLRRYRELNKASVFATVRADG